MYNPINFDSGPAGPPLGVSGDDDMKRRMLMAQLLEQGGQKKPISSWSDGISQGANSFLQAALFKKFGGMGGLGGLQGSNPVQTWT